MLFRIFSERHRLALSDGLIDELTSLIELLSLICRPEFNPLLKEIRMAVSAKEEQQLEDLIFSTDFLMLVKMQMPKEDRERFDCIFSLFLDCLDQSGIDKHVIAQLRII